MNAAAYLLDNCADTHKIAFVAQERSVTYGELRQAVTRLSAFLLNQGTQKGDRVALIADNSLFWVAVYLGSINAGCIAVPVAPSTPAEEVRTILQSATPRVLCLEPKHAAAVRCTSPGTLVIMDEGTSSIARDSTIPFADVLHFSTPEPPTVPEINERHDLASLMFTSGSTGAPRGVMVSHRNIIANTESIISYMGLNGEDRAMVVLPFCYCFGTSLLHTLLRVGGSLVFESRFIFCNTVLERMNRTECTGFAGVPSHYQILLRKSNIRNMSFPTLRWAQQAGGNLAPALVREWCAAVPNARFYVMYGQTEATARLSFMPPELLFTKAGSIGRGIPGVRLSVVDEQGHAVSTGQVGEIVAEGENVTLGYWRDPGDSAGIFRDGKLHTGDLATMDEEGFIYVVDRLKDFIKCGGTRVGCKRIEDVLLSFDGLVEAAVVGMPDPLLGEAARAFVVPVRDDPDLIQRVRDFCCGRLPPHLVPRQFLVLESLPKNPSGKIAKAALRHISPEQPSVPEVT